MIQTETAYREALGWIEECIKVVDMDDTVAELFDLIMAYEVKHFKADYE